MGPARKEAGVVLPWDDRVAPDAIARVLQVSTILVCFFVFPDASLSQSIPGLTGGSGSDGSSEANVVDVDGSAISRDYQRWLDTLVAIEAEIAALSRGSETVQAQVSDLVDRIRAVTEEADRVAAKAENELPGPTDALSVIGTAPTGDDPPEASIIADERDRYHRELATLQAKITYARLIKTRAEQATTMLADFGEDRWLQWIEVREDVTAPFHAEKPTVIRSRYSRAQFEQESFGLWLPIIAAIVGATALIGAIWIARFAPSEDDTVKSEEDDDTGKRAVSRLASVSAYGVFPALAFASAAAMVLYFSDDGVLLRSVSGILFGTALYVWLSRIFSLALEPTNDKAWFLQGSYLASLKIGRLLKGLSAMIAVFIAGYIALATTVQVNAGWLSLLKLATAISFAGYALYVSSVDVFDKGELKYRRGVYMAIRGALAVLGIGVLAAALAGFLNLAVFAAVHIAGSILLIVATYLFRPLIQDGIRAALSDDAGQFNQGNKGAVEAVVNLLLDLVMLLTFTVLMIALWGVPYKAVWLWIRQATSALNFGDFQVTFSDILFAVMVFLVALSVFRMIVRLIRHRVLDVIRLDAGVRDSILTILGYLGFLLAAISAIATLGIDVSNLALLFGALLLGVGFGLQNIVDNLVSGFVILFQRPIKAGDWIGIGDHEGLVLRTGLLSTEISTFEETSVVLPNSEIVSSPVLNRTHGEKRGRVDVPVGVAYGSDVGTVLEILQDCAASNQDVLKSPEPTVILKSFSDSSLDFELRAFIPDITNIFETASELRIAVLKRFTEHGIQIPFPQRDVWFRNAELLREQDDEKTGDDSKPGK